MDGDVLRKSKFWYKSEMFGRRDGRRREIRNGITDGCLRKK